MPFSHSIDNNLEFTYQVLKLKDLNHFWLNRNGTFTPKVSWIGRMIRWIMNLFFDKTIRDIWSVFIRTLNDYNLAKESIAELGCLDSEVLNDANEVLKSRRKRLDFVSRFLFSRKKSFDNWTKYHPKKVEKVKSFALKFQKDLKTNTSINEKDKKKCDQFINTLENIYFPAINTAALPKKAPPIPHAVGPDKQPELYKSLDLRELSTMRNELTIMVSAVITRCTSLKGISTKIRDSYYDHITLYLKNILYQLKNPDIKQDAKDRVLNELVGAADKCPPRWLEESKRQFQAIACGEEKVAEYKILGHVQSLKEDMVNEIILQLPGVEFHLLNSFRSVYGETYGLDDTTVQLDMFAPDIPEALLQWMNSQFLSKYNASRLINGTKERIQLELKDQYNSAYFDKLKSILIPKYKTEEATQEYIQENLYDEDFNFKDEAIVLMLQHVGILKK